MLLKNKSTYTFGLLKLNIYKVLDEYTANGNKISLTEGIAADIEKRFVSTLNMCMRRVALSLPLLTKITVLSFEEDNGKRAVLPKDFGEVKSLIVNGVTVKKDKILTDGDRLILPEMNDAYTGILEYTVKINEFTAETDEDEKINLPDICTDALVFLTASELCPPEYAELYSRLTYRFRDIVSNIYNLEPFEKTRNSFYGSGKRSLKKMTE